MWYHTTEDEANTYIFKACWAYLSAEEFNYGNLLVRREGEHMGRLRSASPLELRDQLSQHSFLEYSLQEWKNHAMDSSTISLHGLAINATKASTLRDAWLQRAAKEGNATVVRQLLQQGAMMTTDMDNMTPMHYAISRSSKELVQCFLDAQVSIDVAVQRRTWQRMDRVHDGLQDIQGYGDDVRRGLTALHYSSLTGCPQMTGFLLQHKADPNAVSEYGETPLHLALKRDLASASRRGVEDRWNDLWYRIEVVREIIDDPEDDAEHLEADRIIEKHRASVLVLLLEDKRTDVTVQDVAGATPLHSVIYGSSNSPEIIRQLIQKGADISARNNHGQTPLHLACFKGDVAAIVTFLEHGADAAATDNGGVNCLHYAAKSGNINAIQKLLATDAINDNSSLGLVASRDLNGRNALHHLVMELRSVDDTVVQYLLELGVNCNELDNDGMSPLACHLRHSCRSYKALQVVQCFLENGSDFKFKTRTRALNLAHIHAKSSNQ